MAMPRPCRSKTREGVPIQVLRVIEAVAVVTDAHREHAIHPAAVDGDPPPGVTRIGQSGGDLTVAEDPLGGSIEPVDFGLQRRDRRRLDRVLFEPQRGHFRLY
jgi:hypothetical protein